MIATPKESRSRTARMLAWGTLAVGVLDIASAIVFFGLRGVMPLQCFQGVAAGLLGREAYQGGLATGLLGGVLHFLIAFSVVAVFAALARRLPFLLRRPILSGLVYGIGVFLFMHYVVVPLSAIGWRPDRLSGLLFGFLGHAFLVGLPASLAVRYAGGSSEPT